MPKTSLSLTQDFRAWAGTHHDFLTLGRVMESQFEDERLGILAELDRTNKRLDAEEASIEEKLHEASDEQDIEALRYRQERLASDRQRAEEVAQSDLNRIRVKLAVTDRESEKTEGNIDELIEDYDFTSAAVIRLTCISFGALDRSCIVSFSTDQFGAVDLSVNGHTPWVRAAFGALDKQMRKNRPWWHFMRYFGVQIILAIAIGIGATSALISLTNPFTEIGTGWGALFVTYGALILAAFIALPLLLG